MQNNKDYKGLRALVTGGTRGIGHAIAKRLLSKGTEVIITGTKEDVKVPQGFDYIKVDFLKHEEVEGFVKKVKTMNIDILINNAGINIISEFDKINIEDFNNIQQINLRVPFLLCQAVIPYMKKNNWGRIVNICSIFGKVSKEYRASYSASKFGLDGMTAALAAEVAKYGILANCISPGVIDTELTRKVLGEEGIKEIVSKIPIGRLGKPEEIAAFVVWLAGPENTYISGQNIAIDGGYTRV
ncbi:MAG: SDR family oxidoreductase [Syntrophorhabdaceae bacterium]|nr:SDR family oxidoreductase [Syntrophorhabdaceae bacterium]